MDKVYLQSIAQAYGADHYQQPEIVHVNTPIPSLNTILIELLEEDDPWALRLAACLLCHPDLCIEDLIQYLSSKGRRHIAHIAACGKRVEPQRALWAKLAHEFGDCVDTNLPHWSRFCTQGKEGYPFMGQHFIWVRPRLNAIVNDA